VAPGLVVVRGGDDPASASYLRQIQRAFGARDLAVDVRTLPVGADEAALAELLGTLGGDRSAHGILVQLPLPEPLSAELVVKYLRPEKDAEGVHPSNAGALAQGRAGGTVPSTPLAGLEILKAAGVPLAGQTAVVVGRSAIVGRPMALLLLQEHATVTICHSRTPNLAAVARQADILVAATGRPGLIDGSMIKPGATVVDFGINVVDGSIVGDVEATSAGQVAGALTPVPGGTGPVTTAVLARNLLDLAERTLGG
jgi:methylenetetrahydrofolate dehydrogenase (NADP+)/methenyltetrahydrofolate cyclohydrolase